MLHEEDRRHDQQDDAQNDGSDSPTAEPEAGRDSPSDAAGRVGVDVLDTGHHRHRLAANRLLAEFFPLQVDALLDLLEGLAVDGRRAALGKVAQRLGDGQGLAANFAALARNQSDRDRAAEVHPLRFLLLFVVGVHVLMDRVHRLNGSHGTRELGEERVAFRRDDLSSVLGHRIAHDVQEIAQVKQRRLLVRRLE